MLCGFLTFIAGCADSRNMQVPCAHVKDMGTLASLCRAVDVDKGRGSHRRIKRVLHVPTCCVFIGATSVNDPDRW